MVIKAFFGGRISGKKTQVTLSLLKLNRFFTNFKKLKCVF